MTLEICCGKHECKISIEIVSVQFEAKDPGCSFLCELTDIVA